MGFDSPCILQIVSCLNFRIMALTNPTKLIDVEELEYFKQKSDVRYLKTYASVSTCESLVDDLT